MRTVNRTCILWEWCIECASRWSTWTSWSGSTSSCTSPTSRSGGRALFEVYQVKSTLYLWQQVKQFVLKNKPVTVVWWNPSSYLGNLLPHLKEGANHFFQMYIYVLYPHSRSSRPTWRLAWQQVRWECPRRPNSTWLNQKCAWGRRIRFDGQIIYFFFKPLCIIISLEIKSQKSNFVEVRPTKRTIPLRIIVRSPLRISIKRITAWWCEGRSWKHVQEFADLSPEKLHHLSTVEFV